MMRVIKELCTISKCRAITTAEKENFICLNYLEGKARERERERERGGEEREGEISVNFNSYIYYICKIIAD